MTVTLYFEFESPESLKEPIILSADAAALIPMAGDIIEDSAGRRHLIADRIFDWDDTNPSITLECVPRAAGPTELDVTLPQQLPGFQTIVE